MTIELSLIPSALAGPSTSFPRSRYDLKEKSSISIDDDDRSCQSISLLYFHLGTFAVEVLLEHVQRHVLSLRQSIHHAVIRLPENCLHLKRKLHRLSPALILHGFGGRRNGLTCYNLRHDGWFNSNEKQKKERSKLGNLVRDLKGRSSYDWKDHDIFRKAKPIIAKENPFPLWLTMNKGWIYLETESKIEKGPSRIVSMLCVCFGDGRKGCLMRTIKVHLKLYLYPIEHFFSGTKIH